MNTSDRITQDLRALGASTSRRLPSATDTARTLDEALARRAASSSPRARRRALTTVGAMALAGALLVAPVPFRHRIGWEATVRGPGGRLVTLHLQARSAEEAQKRIRVTAGQGEALVSLEPRTELAWRTVYAMARETLLRVDVDMNGKSDAEVEAAIAAQLEAQGVTPAHVEVQRGNDSSFVAVGLDDPEGRHVEMVQQKAGPGADRVDLEVEPIDETREPGMTDEQLRDKLVKQFRARGMDAEVTVEGDHVEVRAHKAPAP